MNPEPNAWVLYDDACGFCSRWVGFWAPTLARRGFGVSPLQAPWIREQGVLRHDQLLDDLRLLSEDGSMVEGADVYRFVMRSIWWAYPAYLLSIAPGLRSIFDRTYRAFADNRYRVSHTCRLGER